jgi:hypothetical protein
MFAEGCRCVHAGDSRKRYASNGTLKSTFPRPSGSACYDSEANPVGLVAELGRPLASKPAYLQNSRKPSLHRIAANVAETVSN